MSGIEYGIIAVAIVAASCLQASIGFGLGMLAAPVIALIEPTLLPGIIIMMSLVVTTMVVIRERTQLDLRGAGWALIGRIPGSVLGAYLVVVLPIKWLAFAIGAVVLGGVLISFLGWRPHPRRVTLVAAGTVSGVFGTALAIGGPPMALVWQGMDAARMRGTMSAFYLVGSFVSLISLFVVGAIDTATAEVAGWMVPTLVLGYLLSRLVNRYLNKQRLRLVALLVSAASAILVIVDQVF